MVAVSSSADENYFTNIFCESPEIRGDLYRVYDKQRTEFLEALETSLASGECVWKDYGVDTKLTALYKIDETQVMVSAVFDGVTLYAVTFNEYVE